MELDPVEKSWFGKHPFATTIIVILLIAAAGTALKLLQQIYFPPIETNFTTPVLLNHTFEEVDSLFNLNSNLTDEEKDILFENDYKYNVVEWSCKPLSCQELMGAPTLKLICKDRGFTEDVRISMKEDCVDESKRPEVTVVFQLMSRTTGEYYLGRSGRIVD